MFMASATFDGLPKCAMTSFLSMLLIIVMLNSQVNYAGDPIPYAFGMAQTLGDRIRMLRQSRKMSQDQLGAVLKVSGASVSQWENGATQNLKIENFLRFCSFFNCDPTWLAFGDNPPAWASQPNSKPSTLK